LSSIKPSQQDYSDGRNEGRYGNKRQKECEETQEAETGQAKETRGKEEIVSFGAN
jgi:hypothetical protein